MQLSGQSLAPETVRQLMPVCVFVVWKYSVSSTGRMTEESGFYSLQVKGLAVLQRVWTTDKSHAFPCSMCINLLETKRRLLYLKTQSVPRCKHFSSRLQKPICLCCKWHKSLFVLRYIQNT